MNTLSESRAAMPPSGRLTLTLSRYLPEGEALKARSLTSRGSDPDSTETSRTSGRAFGLSNELSSALTAALAPDLPPLQVDEQSLERVLSNLLVNALAATPARGEIQVQARILPGSDPQEIEIIVADTGCGLNPKEQEHLFEKYRLASEKSGSSGLGLYICKTLVEANHGRIWVESRNGQGSRFHMTFPTSTTGGEVGETAAEMAAVS